MYTWHAPDVSVGGNLGLKSWYLLPSVIDKCVTRFLFNNNHLEFIKIDEKLGLLVPGKFWRVEFWCDGLRWYI